MKRNHLSLTAAVALLALGFALIAGDYEQDAIAAQTEVRRLENENAVLALKVDKLKHLDLLPEGMKATYAGEFTVTSYCGERYPHICGTGDGITASGAPFTPGLTVAADLSVFPLGTVLYIQNIGVRVVQDTGSGLQGQHLDIAVPGTHEEALRWPLGMTMQKVWILKGADSN